MPTTTPSCLVCGSGRLGPLYRGVRDHYGVATGEWDFLRCRECGSATLDPLPGREELEHFYPAAYTFRAGDAGGPPLLRVLGWAERWFYRSIYRGRLRAFVRLTGLRSGRVLEVGCGSGHFLKMLAAAGYDVEGLDISESDTAYARDRLGLRVFHGTLEDLPLDAGRYDAVLLYAVLEHVLDPPATVRRVFRLLKPGGVIVIGVPVIDSLQARLLGRRSSQVTEAPRHVMLPSARGMRGLLGAAGFGDVRSAPTPLLDNAGCVALSLVPGASTPLTHGRERSAARFLRRCAGAALVLPSLAVALGERLPFAGWHSGTTMFSARKPRTTAAR